MWSSPIIHPAHRPSSSSSSSLFVVYSYYVLVATGKPNRGLDTPGGFHTPALRSQQYIGAISTSQGTPIGRTRASPVQQPCQAAKQLGICGRQVGRRARSARKGWGTLGGPDGLWPSSRWGSDGPKRDPSRGRKKVGYQVLVSTQRKRFVSTRRHSSLLVPRISAGRRKVP